MQKSVQRIIRSRRIRNEGITIQGISCTVNIRNEGITIQGISCTVIRSRRRSIRNEGITIQGISCTVITLPICQTKDYQDYKTYPQHSAPVGITEGPSVRLNKM